MQNNVATAAQRNILKATISLLNYTPAALAFQYVYTSTTGCKSFQNNETTYKLSLNYSFNNSSRVCQFETSFLSNLQVFSFFGFIWKITQQYVANMLVSIYMRNNSTLYITNSTNCSFQKNSCINILKCYSCYNWNTLKYHSRWNCPVHKLLSRFYMKNRLTLYKDILLFSSNLEI